MIYYARCQDYVKIGYTKDVVKRINNARTFNPLEIQLLKVTEGTPQQEKEIHKSLSAHIHRGEWFYASREVLEHIQNQPGLDLPEPRAEAKRGIKLTVSDVTLMKALLNNKTTNGHVYLTAGVRKMIVEEYNLCTSNVSKSLKRLVDFGYISGEKGSYNVLKTSI